MVYSMITRCPGPVAFVSRPPAVDSWYEGFEAKYSAVYYGQSHFGIVCPQFCCLLSLGFFFNSTSLLLLLLHLQL